MADYIISRGGRRSAAPTYTPWSPPQSAAAISQAALQQLLRQPQQAQQGNAQLSMRATPQSPQPARAPQQVGPDPAMLQAMFRDAIQQRLDSVEMAGSNDGTASFNESAGAVNPGVARALQFASRLGLGALAGPIGPALFDAFRMNSPAPMATAALGAALPDEARQLLNLTIGKDEVTRVVDETIRAVTRPTAPGPTAPGNPAQPRDPNVTATGGDNYGIEHGNFSPMQQTDYAGEMTGSPMSRVPAGFFGDFGLTGDSDSEGNDRSGGNTGRTGGFGNGNTGMGD